MICENGVRQGDLILKEYISAVLCKLSREPEYTKTCGKDTNIFKTYITGFNVLWSPDHTNTWAYKFYKTQR